MVCQQMEQQLLSCQQQGQATAALAGAAGSNPLLLPSPQPIGLFAGRSSSRSGSSAAVSQTGEGAAATECLVRASTASPLGDKKKKAGHSLTFNSQSPLQPQNYTHIRITRDGDCGERTIKQAFGIYPGRRLNGGDFPFRECKRGAGTYQRQRGPSTANQQARLELHHLQRQHRHLH